MDLVVAVLIEAGVLEVLSGELGEGFAVEGVFEVLKGQSVVEDVGCEVLVDDRKGFEEQYRGLIRRQQSDGMDTYHQWGQ